VKRFLELCPKVPINVEIISGFAHEVPYFKKEFWKVWPKARAQGFAKFLELAKKGKAIPPHHSADAKAEQDYQRAELERSLKYCKEVLGLGLIR
jgi:3-oxoisoapionate decarboxylase